MRQKRLNSGHKSWMLSIESMVEAVIVYNEHGQAVRSNPAVRKMYGFDPVTTHRQEMIDRLNLRTIDDAAHTPETLPSGRALSGSWFRKKL
jgi:PAS domain-containing protein